MFVPPARASASARVQDESPPRALYAAVIDQALVRRFLNQDETAFIEIMERYRGKIFTITLGKEGTMLGFQNSTHIVPSIAVKPVDTTGAGDAFVGAVLYQLSDKSLEAIGHLSLLQWQQVVGNANKAGARTCEYLGAMEAFKHLNNQIFN